jgi:hypothetical protein
METCRQGKGSAETPKPGKGFDVSTPANGAPSIDVSISLLRGLASAGYFSAEQLSKIELVLRGGPAPLEDRHWLTIAEACRYARVSRTSLHRYAVGGFINIRKLRGRRLVDQQELERLIEKADKL